MRCRGFAVRHLQNILRIDDAFDVMNALCVHRHARVVLGPEHFDETFHRGFHRHGKHLWTRLHGFAHRLATEFDHGLDEIAVTFLNNSFFLSSFDQSIYRLRPSFWFLTRILAGQRGDRLQEPAAGQRSPLPCRKSLSRSAASVGRNISVLKCRHSFDFLVHDLKRSGLNGRGARALSGDRK